MASEPAAHFLRGVGAAVETEAVAFRIVDSADGHSARGDWTGTMEGIVRPMLPWTNEVTESVEAPAADAKSGRLARG